MEEGQFLAIDFKHGSLWPRAHVLGESTSVPIQSNLARAPRESREEGNGSSMPTHAQHC